MLHRMVTDRSNRDHACNRPINYTCARLPHSIPRSNLPHAPTPYHATDLTGSLLSHHSRFPPKTIILAHLPNFSPNGARNDTEPTTVHPVLRGSAEGPARDSPAREKGRRSRASRDLHPLFTLNRERKIEQLRRQRRQRRKKKGRTEHLQSRGRCDSQRCGGAGVAACLAAIRDQKQAGGQ